MFLLLTRYECLNENHKKIENIDLVRGYNELCKDEDFIEYTRYNTTDFKVVTNRIEKVKEIIIGQ